jgi:prepilin-type processing-associated H-X9-DG protein/prepilin-type N-terminal cleavage/methylation domain-containing protein
MNDVAFFEGRCAVWGIRRGGTLSRAFSLVELLVVLGIIAIVIGLLLPSMTAARRHSRTVVCLSNLHQIEVAFQLYVNQNRGKSFVAYGDADHYWPYILKPELLSVSAVILCPEAPEDAGIATHPGSSPRRGTAFNAWAQINVGPPAPVPGRSWNEMRSSYGLSFWLSALRPGPPPPFGDESMRDLYFTLPAQDSSAIPVFADCTATAAFPRDTDTPPDNLHVPVPLTGNVGPEYSGLRNFCMARHGRAINVVFLDGHAQTVPLPDLWKLKWNRQFVPTHVTLPRE